MTVHCTKTPDAYNLSKSDPSRITCRTHQVTVQEQAYCHNNPLHAQVWATSLHCRSAVRRLLFCSIALLLSAPGRQPPLLGSASLSSLLQHRFASVPPLSFHCFHALLLVLIVHCFPCTAAHTLAHCFKMRFHPMSCPLIPCFNIQITFSTSLRPKADV